MSIFFLEFFRAKTGSVPEIELSKRVVWILARNRRLNLTLSHLPGGRLVGGGVAPGPAKCFADAFQRFPTLCNGFPTGFCGVMVPGSAWRASTTA